MQCFVDVTQEDINLGERKDCDNCAVARAIRRKMNVGTYISVSDEAMTIGYVELKSLPLPIVNFINDFDNGNPRFSVLILA